MQALEILILAKISFYAPKRGQSPGCFHVLMDRARSSGAGTSGYLGTDSLGRKVPLAFSP